MAKNTLFISAIQPTPWTPPYPTPGSVSSDFPPVDHRDDYSLRLCFRPSLEDDGHASSSTTLTNDSEEGDAAGSQHSSASARKRRPRDDERAGGVELAAKLFTMSKEDFSYAELPSPGAWRRLDDGLQVFHNCGDEAFEATRAEFRARSVAHDDVPQPPAVDYEALVDGLSNTRRTFVLPNVVKLNDLFEVYQDVWEAE